MNIEQATITRPDWRQNPDLVECFEDCREAMRRAAGEPNRATDGSPGSKAPPSNTDSSQESNR